MAIRVPAELRSKARFWLPNQWQSSWGHVPALPVAQLGRAGRESTSTGRFRVGGSRCGPRPARARLRKTCYHSCDTDLLENQKGFNVLYILCLDEPLTTEFFMPVKWNFVDHDASGFRRAGDRPKPRSSLRSIFRSFVGLWVKLGYGKW